MDKPSLAAPSSPSGKPKQVPLHLIAGSDLNAASDGKPLSLVVKIYYLRETTQFEQASFDDFLDPERDRAVLGNSLVAASEVLLVPGKRYDAMQAMPGDAAYLGVVSLFRSPSASRWRLTFDSKKSLSSGITIELHGCAMSTIGGALVTPPGNHPSSPLSSGCAPDQH